MMARKDNPFALTTPCGNCPFRKDRPFYLGKERAEGISDSLKDGASFHCHKTVNYDEEDENGNAVVSTSGSKICAGALATMKNEGLVNRSVQLGMGLGIYNPDDLNPDAPVFDSLDKWVESMKF